MDPSATDPAPPRGRRGDGSARLAVRLLVLFLMAVVVGRLMLEPHGVGWRVLVFLLPVLAVLAVALYGWRAGLVGLALILVLALLARWAFAATPQAWLLFLLAPVVLATLAVLVSVLRRMAADRRAKRSG